MTDNGVSYGIAYGRYDLQRKAWQTLFTSELSLPVLYPLQWQRWAHPSPPKGLYVTVPLTSLTLEDWYGNESEAEKEG
jgi:hypothetical protein